MDREPTRRASCITVAGFCGILSLFAGLCGVASAESPLRLKASWKERHARIEAFSPDGRSLVSSGEGGCCLRDAETGQVRAVLHEARHGLRGPRFSSDGKLLYAKVRSEEYKPVEVYDLKAWDVATGRPHGTIPYISESINTVTDDFALSPDGMTLATLDNSERLPMVVQKTKSAAAGLSEFEISRNVSKGLPRIKIWSVPDWKLVRLLDGGSHMLFSPDGTTLVTGARDRQVATTRIWDASTWNLRSELEGVAPRVKPMTFSPDGKFLAMGGREDATLRDLAGGGEWTLPLEYVRSPAPVFSPDGTLLFPNGLPSGHPDRNIGVDYKCYDVSSLPPRRFELGKGEFVPSPVTEKEARLLVSLAGMKYVEFGEAAQQLGERTYEVRTLPGRELVARSTVTGLVRAELSPDGRWIALLAGRNEKTFDESGSQFRQSIHLVDSASTQVATTVVLPADTWGGQGFAFSPDSRVLVVSYRKPIEPSTEGVPDPPIPPVSVDLWELPPR